MFAVYALIATSRSCVLQNASIANCAFDFCFLSFVCLRKLFIFIFNIQYSIFLLALLNCCVICMRRHKIDRSTQRAEGKISFRLAQKSCANQTRFVKASRRRATLDCSQLKKLISSRSLIAQQPKPLVSQSLDSREQKETSKISSGAVCGQPTFGQTRLVTQYLRSDANSLMSGRRRRSEALCVRATQQQQTQQSRQQKASSESLQFCAKIAAQKAPCKRLRIFHFARQTNAQNGIQFAIVFCAALLAFWRRTIFVRLFA